MTGWKGNNDNVVYKFYIEIISSMFDYVINFINHLVFSTVSFVIHNS